MSLPQMWTRLFLLLSIASAGTRAAKLSFSETAKEDKRFWYEQGKDDLMQAINRKFNFNVAKNVIFFLGDGMGVSTVTAARIHRGQKQGKSGEEHSLTFDKFPNVGLVKTYNVDRQVPDSAGTATAYLTGAKGRYATIGLDATAAYNKCQPELGTKPHVDSILKWAQDAGKDTGFVTTTRVTHATPAGLYAHIPNRDWECQLPPEEAKSGFCKDIARQLIEDEPGRNAKIILGGGRTVFEPNFDNGTAKWPCKRGDGRDLISQWKNDKIQRGKSHAYLQNREDLMKLDVENTDYVFGLFSPSHIPYETDRKPDTPGIVDMTETAIKFLQKSQNGFFLLVEGGRIDHAHHLNMGLRALEEAVALDKAIELAQKMVNLDDTLIVVTADHSHGFTINGYPERGNPITGIADVGDNGYNYTTMLYATGPGFWSNINHNMTNTSQPWKDASTMDTAHKEYKQMSPIPQADSSHGGEDVAVFATGPMSHIFYGVHEQSYVAHAMGYAACIGPHANDCHVPQRAAKTNAAQSVQLANFLIILPAVWTFVQSIAKLC